MTAEALLTLISHLSLLVSTVILCLIGKSMVGVIRLMRKELWELRGLIASQKTKEARERQEEEMQEKR